MLSEMMKFYGLTRPLQQVGTFETDHHRKIIGEIKTVIPLGRIIVVSAIVGSGKTWLLRRLKTEIDKDDKMIASKSLFVEKRRLSLITLIHSLFYDVSGDLDFSIPKQGEKRERALRDLIASQGKPVALFVDEAHDIHPKTLVALKRLIEVVSDSGGKLSIVLIGHPKLHNDLQRPQMEEVGDRSVLLEFDGIAGEQRAFIEWLLDKCTKPKTDWSKLIAEEAVDLLASKLRTPLQIESHLTRAFEQGHKVGAIPITKEVVSNVISKAIDDIEPVLTRHGYDMKTLVDQFGAKPSEIRQYLAGTLAVDRTRELTEELKSAGLPV